MQPLSLSLVLLLATTALAKDPYIHSFSNADCSGSDAGDKVSISVDECTVVNTKYNSVQVNFGTMLEEITLLDVFSDQNCTVYAGKPINTTMAAGTPAQCVLQDKHGGKWLSVQKASP